MKRFDVRRHIKDPLVVTVWATLGAVLTFLMVNVPIDRGRAAEPKFQPYYLEKASYKRDDSGVMVMFFRQVIARRSDGSLATIDYFKNRPGLRRVVTPDTSLTWLVDPVLTKTSWPKGSAQGIALARDANRNTTDCDIGEPGEAHDLIGGVDTIAVTEKLDTVQRQTSWYAPALGCQVLQFRRFTDQGVVLSKNIVLRLDLKEPDLSLFDLGKEYASVGPSDLTALQHRAGGEQMTASDAQRLFPDIEREFQALRYRDRH